MADKSPYEILGVLPDATSDEIRRAFRQAALQHHPDTSSGVTDALGIRSVIEAYRLLVDPTARARYDAAHQPLDSGDRRLRRVPERGAPSVRDFAPDARSTQETSRFCSECHGSGTIRAIVTCPACRGRAEVTVLGARRALVMPCPTCRGAGRMISRGTCRRCHGRGISH
jgi:DnaJ-class molecular chaperone